MPILFTEILLLFGLTVAVAVVTTRLHLPTIVSFLLTGMLAGPHGLGIISAMEEVEHLAEIGVILLLFTVGLEFSLERLNIPPISFGEDRLAGRGSEAVFVYPHGAN